jgi:DNA-directed RNA polymerase specialized sigma24 family protein
VADESRNWSRDTEELATCFTIHARDLFGDACVLSDADRAVAGDLVQGAFEAAAAVWSTLRDLPADQCHDWLLDRLAAAAQDRTGHPADSSFASPAHRRITGLKTARFRADYDAVAGLERFAAWLGTRPAGNGDSPALDEAANQPGAGLAGRPGIRPAGLRALANGTAANGTHLNATPANRATANGRTASGVSVSAQASNGSGRGGPGSTRGNGASVPPGSYGDPVSALYEEHYAPLVRLAALLVRDTATAEEIVQDSFVAVAAAWRRRDTDGALDVLRQSVLDRSRSALRHGITPAPAATGPPPGSPGLLAALGALPPRQREVLVLRYYANLSEEQAADTIGISRAAVRRHATRANAALRTVLDAG